jgi:hypothetical protein
MISGRYHEVEANNPVKRFERIKKYYATLTFRFSVSV